MKISLYFIFYVAMILELLTFIEGRDEAEEQHQRDLAQMYTLADSLADVFSQPLGVNVPDVTRATTFSAQLQHAIGHAGEMTNVVIAPLGLWSDRERAAVEFTVRDASGAVLTPAAGEYDLAKNALTGNAVFSKAFAQEGEYRFSVTCRVRRVVPEYYPQVVRDSVTAKLRRKLGDDMIIAAGKDVPFTIVVRAEGKKLPPCMFCGQGPYK